MKKRENFFCCFFDFFFLLCQSRSRDSTLKAMMKFQQLHTVSHQSRESENVLRAVPRNSVDFHLSSDDVESDVQSAGSKTDDVVSHHVLMFVESELSRPLARASCGRREEWRMLLTRYILFALDDIHLLSRLSSAT